MPWLTASRLPGVQKTAVRLNDNYAGVYGTVLCPGTISAGQEVFLLDQP